ncbi:MAG: hypothetical protein JXA30_07825 [Deltaproteobacteria bacterium]|nr:hypothetical protein [Deltaproteobacteria bacterium]
MDKFAFVSFIVVLSLISACEDRERKESRLLLERLRSVDIRMPYDKRKSAVTQIEALVFTEKKLSQIRDRCVRAHRALIEAEEQQEKAKRVLERATALDANASIKEPDLAVIAEAVSRSNDEIKRAKDAFPSCDRAIRGLELRFASGHRLR